MADVPHVVVLGAGPAGCTAAGTLASAGARVTLVERERFPRHKVGESLQPATFQLLDAHLGLTRAEVETQRFARKYGAVYVWGEKREPWRVIFDRRLEEALSSLDEPSLLAGDYEHAWQVDRARFDALLLEKARQAGAEVRSPVEALEPVGGGDGLTGVRLRDASGHSWVESADLVMDATGQRCLLGRAMGLTEPVEDMRSTATYAYFEGAGGVPGPLGRHVQLVITVDEGWVWFIPIGPDRTSIGVVHRDRERWNAERFAAALADAGLPSLGRQDSELLHARDWSFTHRRLAGRGWMLLGDAGSFVDPILSGGVDAAVRSAATGALAWLQTRDGDAQAVQRWEAKTRRDYRAMLRLARYWYGNNRSRQGLFWQAFDEVRDDAMSTPLRAFVYLTSGHYAADPHLKVFQDWQERRIFEALGVDRGALARARARRGGER